MGKYIRVRLALMERRMASIATDDEQKMLVVEDPNFFGNADRRDCQSQDMTARILEEGDWYGSADGKKQAGAD